VGKRSAEYAGRVDQGGKLGANRPLHCDKPVRTGQDHRKLVAPLHRMRSEHGKRIVVGTGKQAVKVVGVARMHCGACHPILWSQAKRKRSLGDRWNGMRVA
jgi:hypothetical protein